MGIGGVRVDYTDGGGLQHTWQKYIATDGDAANFLAGDGTTIHLATATPTGSNSNAGQVARAFIKSYEFVASVGSNIRSISADFRVSGGPGTVEATASFNWDGFTPNGGSPNYGPYPTGFCASKARAEFSHRAGWIRFYTTGSILFQQTTVFDPSTIDSEFTQWLTDLTAFSGFNVNYAVWTGYGSVDGRWEGFTPYSTTTLRIGAKNG